ncbi:transporter substrate-binding domain-containing protein [Lachnospiraceae bacterium ZAX-1]
MKERKRIVALLMATGMIMATMAGCGSKADNTKAAENDTLEDASSDTPSDEATGDVEKVSIALDANVAPFTNYDEDGNLAGFDYEVLQKIDELLPEFEFEYEMVDYDAAAIGLEAGQYDLEAGDKYKTSARAEKFLITDSYFYTAIVMAVKADSGIASIEDMKGKALVPVPQADGLRQVYVDYMAANPDADITQETGSSLISIADGLQYVANGRYDAMINDPGMFKDTLDADADLAGKITVTEDPFTVVGAHFIINKEKTALAEAVNGAIATLKADGTLGEMTAALWGEDIIEKYKEVALD